MNRLAIVVLTLGTWAAVTAEAEDQAAKKYSTSGDIATSCDAPPSYARMLFPEGRKKAVTMSYDDGRIHDRRLVAIFNKYGIRGTFNLISDPLDKDGYITRKEIKDLFQGHEVAAHTIHHPPLTQQTDEVLAREILENRADLERLVGYAVRGLAYPGGDADERTAAKLARYGIAYARCVGATQWMAVPDAKSRNVWNCTCHHGDCLKQADRLLSWTTYPALLSVWGHSYEFEDNKNWDLIEEFCKKIGGRKDIWYATNIEVFDYVDAVRRLIVSADGTFIENPTAIPVWLEVQGRVVQLKPGAPTRVIETK